MLLLCALRQHAAGGFAGLAAVPAGRSVAQGLLYPANSCEHRPCRNRGSCSVAGDDFLCTCASGFAGGICEINIDDCFVGACSNGGVCIDGVDTYSCECANGWTGASCNTRTRNLDVVAEVWSVADFSQQFVAGVVDSLNVAPEQVVPLQASYSVSAHVSWSGSIPRSNEFPTSMATGLAVGLGVDPSAIQLEMGGRRQLAELVDSSDPRHLAERHNQPRRSSKVPERMVAIMKKVEMLKAKREAKEERYLSKRRQNEKAADRLQRNASAPDVAATWRRMEEEENAAEMTFVVSGLTESECTSVISAAEDVTGLFTAINAIGILNLNVEGAASAVTVTAALEIVVTSGTVSDSAEFDQALDAALADTDGLRLAINGAGGSVTSFESVQLVSLESCLQNREIPGSDRTAQNLCPTVTIGQECNYECVNGARPSGKHICQADGSFRGGGCGRRPAPECPAAWEQMRADAACDSELTVPTDPRQPTAAGSEGGYWSRLQYWTECSSDVVLANVLCTSPITNGAPCELAALPIGDTEVEIQAWDPVGMFDSRCRVMLHVVDEEAPVPTPLPPSHSIYLTCPTKRCVLTQVISEGSCPGLVSTRMGSSTLPGDTPTVRDLAPSLKAVRVMALRLCYHRVLT